MNGSRTSQFLIINDSLINSMSRFKPHFFVLPSGNLCFFCFAFSNNFDNYSLCMNIIGQAKERELIQFCINGKCFD